MWKFIFLFSFFILINFSLSAQKLTIYGYVSEGNSGETVAGANISSTENKSSTISNSYGYFSLIAKIGTNRIITTSLGFNADTVEVVLTKDTLINIKLISIAQLLEEVSVNSSHNSILNLTSSNNFNLSMAAIKSMPRLAGEVDLVKAVQMLPGIKPGREGSSDYYVRGGGAEQNLILLDGVPIYQSSHALGFFSVFNTDAIKNVELMKGGFPARFGGRLSSVLDIQLKDGNAKSLKYDFSVGLLSSKFLLEGPIKKDQTTFLIGIRRTYLDIFSAIAQSNQDNKLNYHFYDLNAKLSHRISSKDRIYLSTYSGSDNLTSKSANDTSTDGNENNNLGWGSITSAIRYNHIFSSRLFCNTALTYTKYRFQTSTEYKDFQSADDYLLTYHSNIRDVGFKTDLDYIPNNKNIIRFGINTTFHRFDPNVTRLKSNDQNADNLIGDQKSRNLEYYVYIEDEIEISDNLQANVGLHYSSFQVSGKFYSSLQPRIHLNYLLNENLSFRTSYSSMAQYIHLLSNPGTGSPTDIWVPSTVNIKPEKSWQSTVGFATSFNVFEFSLDAYYKNLKNVLEYTSGVNFLEEGLRNNLLNQTFESWENKVSSGEGKTYGSELFIKKSSGKLSGWVGYTLSWSDRTFKQINQGTTYPFKYDSRNNFSFTANYKLKKTIEISGNFVYYSGLPTTLPLSEYKYYSENKAVNTAVQNVDVRNNFRMRDYHRLDLSISFIKEKSKGIRSWNVSIYNIYNRKNPYYVEIYQNKENGSTNISQYSLLPIIPSISYSYKLK